ncbi:hypothetical protein BLA60_06035 [Actinophytocola xinjiangensis]|uniref:Secreted protein n=1 Tax=Actinophytocola xinjiangensis TaxID=485602 RepID=A0A7Z0WRW6_9PSEU|nr:hypothetical protein [Actinophytocola xinjiangensis]OLF12827.1 hypothetical protein BLA60_06035 [Actinophytocola xinjiangensis]
MRALFPIAAAVGLLAWGGVSAIVATEAVAAPTSVVGYPPNCPDNSKRWDLEYRSLVCFNPTGEHMFVCDTKADGARASAWYRGSDDEYFTRIDNTHGVYTCLDVNFDMPEDTYIEYQSCAYDADRPAWNSCRDGATKYYARG